MWMEAKDVAVAGFEALERNKPVEVPGLASKGIAVLAKVLPDPVALRIMASQGSRYRRLE